MKNKHSFIALVLSLALCCALVLTACGGNGDGSVSNGGGGSDANINGGGGEGGTSDVAATDFSTYTYADYAKENWDAKTISYQMYTTDVVNGPMGIKAEYLMNLYSDGSALLYQAGLWDTTSVDDAHWYDQANHIAWAYFGMWEEANGEVKVRLIGDLAARTDTVDMSSADESWIRCIPSDRDNEDQMGQTVQIKVSTSTLTFTGGDDYNYLPMGSTNKIMGAALQDNEGDGSNAQGGLALSASPQYATIQDWVNTYIDSEFSEGQAGM